ncbi:3D domain-containing protein [Peptoniphilus raoultii]|uniref:3D domain-containing protein n=1 Tax=Peptoniphilus raoultii TaxID=1776387 RepID=UPI0008D978D0|nr:3D domain-containing protein [Peptoniphilus raoultii]
MKKNKKRNSYFKILTVAMFLISLLTMGFSTILGKNIILIRNGEATEIFTYSRTVEEVLKEENIKLKDNEELSTDKKDEVYDGMEIKIAEVKTYKILDGKKSYTKLSNGASVAEVLSNLGIKVGKLDRVNPSLDTATDKAVNMEITIQRVREENLSEESEIVFKKTIKENSDLERGNENIITKGENGLREDKIKETYVNDELESREVIESSIIKEPVNEIVEVGTKEVKESPKGDISGRCITMEATAYDYSAGNVTALGTQVRVGAVAVDPNVIPLGSKLYIESTDSWPSYGYAVAEDTGGAIKGNRIDLFFTSSETSNNFGRRTVKVYVLDK